MPLQPGFSSPNFDSACKELRRVVGDDHLVISGDRLAAYFDPYSPGLADAYAPSGAVLPASADEVRAVLGVANNYRLPLWTVSLGRNYAYGGAAPCLKGSMVLDLSRMRAIEVNAELAYALVEPGVTYLDLYKFIRDKTYPLWIDCPDPGWGSVIGNALDHGAGRTPLPYRDHFGAHCGMEVVLANGEVVRTGMGALPTAKTWQHFQYGAGPSSDGLFAQSNMGVVTKMGFWLLPEPQASMTGQIRVSKHDDIVPFVKILASLAFQGVINCVFSLQSPVFAGRLDAEKSALLDKPGGGSAAEWDAYAASKGRTFWQTELRFYGPAKVIAAQWDHVKEKVSAIAGAQFTDGQTMHFPLTDEQVAKLNDPGSFGVPSLNVFSTLQGSSGHLDASPMLPYDGNAILEAHKVFMKLFRDAGTELLLGFAMSYHWRAFIMFQSINLVRDPAQMAKARSLYEQVIKVASAHGWGIYRAHAAFMDTVMEQYSYNDHALMRLNETLKDALDPNGILSAGRYGIWPKQLRKGRA